MTTVQVSVITHRRPHELDQLLHSIAALTPAAPGWTQINTLVVDNDPNHSAKPVAERHGVDYLTEAEPGISAARNLAVETARSAGATFVAFVDDDQTVTPEWLHELTRTQSQNAAAAVIGAVAFHHPGDTPEWYVSARVFEDQLVDGSQPPGYFSTNNCLLQIDPAPVSRPLFAAQFGLTGGSDHHLGARLLEAGATVAYAPGALAHENVLDGRVNRRYAIQRLIRKGATLAVVDRAIAVEHHRSEAAVKARHFAAGSVRILGGAVRGAVRIRNGPAGIASGFRTSLIGVGQILGAFDLNGAEYRDRHQRGG